MLAFAAYHDGQPAEKWPENMASRAYCLYLADADDRPQERAFDTDVGRLACYCPGGVRRRLFIRHHVDGFGDPVLRTRLLHSGRTLHNLSVELALGRMELIDSERAKAALEGLSVSPSLMDKLQDVRQTVQRVVELDSMGDRATAARLADASLTVSVPAGEEMALEFARERMARRLHTGSLAGFRFGCTGGAFAPGIDRGNRFLEAFNYATLPFYLSGMEPQEGDVRHEPVLASARELRSRGIALKGHPLVWTYTPCLPPHRRAMDFATCCRVFRDRILRDVPPFRGLIDYWDIINEAHDTPWANSFAFTSDQMVELTKVAGEAAREAAPDAKLVVNVCLPFGEYAAGAPGRATTLEYVRSCIDAGVPFDIVGVQFYYGGGLLQYCWDMLEISRILDEYAALGREVHVTELGTPSAMGPDPNAMIKEGNDVGLWHKEWNERTQADWVEQFCTICMSMEAITAATWWSFSDAAKVFWPHSGLLDKHDAPKEAFRRLVTLRKMASGR